MAPPPLLFLHNLGLDNTGLIGDDRRGAMAPRGGGNRCGEGYVAPLTLWM